MNKRLKTIVDRLYGSSNLIPPRNETTEKDFDDFSDLVGDVLKKYLNLEINEKYITVKFKDKVIIEKIYE